MGKLLDWQRQAVLDAYISGEKAVAIAAEFGISNRYPCVLARRSGFEVRANGRPRLEKGNSTTAPC